jgi:hypothetical protein
MQVAQQPIVDVSVAKQSPIELRQITCVIGKVHAPGHARYRSNALSIGESGPLIVREVAIERAIADAGMHRVIVGVDVQNDDPLELGQGEASEVRRLNSDEVISRIRPVK